ncbi:DUF4157 domain-containing protein [Actinomadura sp. DC4]|uniref:eCIS core domain-containing protein n=1 Tax=Actinomadura sp. DC4 TaxID=3055069 RepID=UPI0025AF89C8|nr:DUF4157 domain-containing protein [Actinomadura sp. DC4]MDN3354474.1 DUF4157 domain-containing protein [Actinomadura sp. DC4]
MSAADVAVLQRQVGNRATASVLGRVPSRPEAIQSAPGRPLAPPVRARLESAFGADLSSVRVHTDETAHRSAESVGARAYTMGSHIAFARGWYAPGSADGLRLLGHEVAHVLQQSAHRASGTDRGDGVKVSRPGDPQEREAEAAGAAVTMTSRPHGSPGRGRPGTTTPARGSVVQRSVGLELEHNVPIYEKKSDDQEQSLRQGAYEYDNKKVIYKADEIDVKVDNSQYGWELAKYLHENRSKLYDNKLPKLGISIPEYTTRTPGLDELKKNAKGEFVKHTQDIKREININNKGQAGPGFYTGLPKSISDNFSYSTYRGLSVQFTLGVFPSKLDQLHRLSTTGGFATGGPLWIQQRISALIDGPLSPVIDAIVDGLQKETNQAEILKEEEGKGKPARDKGAKKQTEKKKKKKKSKEEEEVKVPVESAKEGRFRLAQKVEEFDWLAESNDDISVYEYLIDPRMEALRTILRETTMSIFRVVISYYLAARWEIPEKLHEKNAVALLARTDLTEVFRRAGLVQRHQEIFVEVFGELVRAEEATIVGIINSAVEELEFNEKANEKVLKYKGSIVDLMIDVVRGKMSDKDFYAIQPGSSPEKPDPLKIEGAPANDPGRLESGGTQFEFRTADVANWDGKFVELGKRAFELNTAYLPDDQRDELRKETGWT